MQLSLSGHGRRSLNSWFSTTDTQITTALYGDCLASTTSPQPGLFHTNSRRERQRNETMNYTKVNLDNDVFRYNVYLKKEGSNRRLERGGRNNYQAVDVYTVDSDGKRIGSGVDNNVCCGTSRECGEAVEQFYSNECCRLTLLKVERLEQELAARNAAPRHEPTEA